MGGLGEVVSGWHCENLSMVNKRVFLVTFLLLELLLIGGGVLLARLSSNPIDQEFATLEGMFWLVGSSIPFVAVFSFIAGAIASKGK